MKATLSFVVLSLVVNSISSTIVQIEDGRIEGSMMVSRLGRQFHSFRRIPFAEPPVGALRYAAPIRNRPWTGILNGTSPARFALNLRK